MQEDKLPSTHSELQSQQSHFRAAVQDQGQDQDKASTQSPPKLLKVKQQFLRSKGRAFNYSALVIAEFEKVRYPHI